MLELKTKIFQNLNVSECSFYYVTEKRLKTGFFCAFLKNSRGENSSFFRNSRPKTQGLFQNSRYWRFLTKFSKKLKVSEVFMPIFQTWIIWRILPISSETRYQRYLLIDILQIEKKTHVYMKNSWIFQKTRRIFKKTQGKNSSYRRFPPHVIIRINLRLWKYLL